MKLLVVGDYHAEPSDLADCQRLADYIVELAKKHDATVLFTGDQYHTHAIIHAEVQKFWFDFYRRLGKSISLVGNHDKPGSASSKATAMLAHVDHTEVISEPVAFKGVLFMPYMHEAADFVAVANQYPNIKTIICHQTFDGSRYENGFYAEGGVDLNLIPQKNVISGHIHTPQKVGKVWYVGAPRWRILTDANVDRAIWYVEIVDGEIVETIPYDTGKVCRQIRTLVDTEADPVQITLDPQHEWRVDIHGTAAWIEQRVPLFKGMGAKVRTFKAELEAPKVRESEGVDVAFSKWASGYKAQHGTDNTTLISMLKERVPHVQHSFAS